MLILTMFLTNCSGVKQLSIFKEEVKRQELNLDKPSPLVLERIKWHIITEGVVYLQVRLLLHHGAQRDGSLLRRMLGEVQAGGNGGTALHCAAEHTGDEVVALLLRNDANPLCVSARGETPLQVAA